MPAKMIWPISPFLNLIEVMFVGLSLDVGSLSPRSWRSATTVEEATGLVTTTTAATSTVEEATIVITTATTTTITATTTTVEEATCQ